jgi:hypothetical protein
VLKREIHGGYPLAEGNGGTYPVTEFDTFDRLDLALVSFKPLISSTGQMKGTLASQRSNAEGFRDEPDSINRRFLSLNLIDYSTI